ncbi:MraY family glycosyltransferase [Methanothermococcus okinawensis]|uniref:Glycosyl transferase, family 4, conserved region-containing protein n=1 Tax=Methanothermococcus okinawensis (strain DSM 14208 / JCM 11175 / IH1) TaxID=647113 RepID=F8AM80_METOI|nr:glycosyltransferase 4 family protein [Methanothermococcus okinawensis]AEH06767.1 Glycosyl transferase, family 4, conserved region-containing protein [Methanothermococcus okinawensis IH1]
MLEHCLNIYFLGVLCLLCFICSYIFTRIYISKMINYKYGIDLHKREKTKVPEMGGIVPVSLSALIISIFNPIISSVLLMSGIIGIYDDLYKLSPYKKLILLGLIGIPIGYLLFGFNIFKIILLVLAISISSNLTNMLAGFNGLEIGLGVISAFFLGIVLLLNGDYYGFEIVMIFLSSYFGFFILNRYPAKIFPGDVGTLSIGAFLATIAIWRNVILEFIIIMLPYIIDAFLKYYSAGVTKRENHTPTVLGEDGKLHVKGGYLSLPRIILKKKPMKEYNIVIVLWSISIFFGILAVLFNRIINY